MSDGWSGIAAEYDRSFARLCAGAVEPLLDELGPPGEWDQLLDAGTGTGIVAAAAIRRGWFVTGVDIEEDMTELAAERVPAAEFLTASIASIPSEPGAFDAIAANFSINHADHAEGVVRELHRVAARDAPIAVTVWPWQPSAMNALWGAIMEATGTRPERFALPEGELFERSEDGLVGLLRGGGFHDASARRIDWEFAISADDLWVGIAAGIATIGQAYLRSDDAGRTRIRTEYERRSAELAPDGMLRFPVSAILAVARA